MVNLSTQLSILKILQCYDVEVCARPVWGAITHGLGHASKERECKWFLQAKHNNHFCKFCLFIYFSSFSHCVCVCVLCHSSINERNFLLDVQSTLYYMYQHTYIWDKCFVCILQHFWFTRTVAVVLLKIGNIPITIGRSLVGTLITHCQLAIAVAVAIPCCLLSSRLRLENAVLLTVFRSEFRFEIVWHVCHLFVKRTPTHTPATMTRLDDKIGDNIHSQI